MTTFLEQLGAELDGAASRIVDGDRPRPRIAPGLALLAAVVAVVVLLAGGGSSEQEAQPATKPSGAALAGPSPALRDLTLDVADHGGAESLLVRGQLQSAGWSLRGPAPAPDRTLTTSLRVPTLAVVYGTAPRAVAERVAARLGVDRVEPAPADLRSKGVVLVLGDRPGFPSAIAAFRAWFSVIGADGTGVAHTAHGPVRVFLVGTVLCFSDRGGSTCGAPLAEAVRGRVVLTTTKEDDRDILSATGIVPDGPTSVTVDGKTVPVHDNVWVHGRTKAHHVDIPGIGRVGL